MIAKIKFQDKLYNYGYYFHIYDKEGKCLGKIDNSFNPISILFKNNIFISCTYSGIAPIETEIYRIYSNLIDESKTLKFYSAPNSSEDIKIIDKTPDEFKSELSKYPNAIIKMNLIFLTTQKGKENSPDDIIQTVYTKMELEALTGNKISLNIKFVDFSYYTIINSKNNKITNSISLPQKLLEKLSE